MSTTSQINELDILKDVIAADESGFSPELARAILTWKFSHRTVSRMNELADLNRDGTISDSELEELQKYLRVGGLVNLLQAKARLSLRDSGQPT